MAYLLLRFGFAEARAPSTYFCEVLKQEAARLPVHHVEGRAALIELPQLNRSEA